MLANCIAEDGEGGSELLALLVEGWNESWSSVIQDLDARYDFALCAGYSRVGKTRKATQLRGNQVLLLEFVESRCPGCVESEHPLFSFQIGGGENPHPFAKGAKGSGTQVSPVHPPNLSGSGMWFGRLRRTGGCPDILFLYAGYRSTARRGRLHHSAGDCGWEHSRCGTRCGAQRGGNLSQGIWQPGAGAEAGADDARHNI